MRRHKKCLTGKKFKQQTDKQYNDLNEKYTRITEAEEGISELEDRLVEITATEQKEKNAKK